MGKRKTHPEMGMRSNKEYCDGHIKHMNQKLATEGMRYCKGCGQIKRVDDFRLRYWQVTKETKELQPNKQEFMPVYYGTCIECETAKHNK